MLRIIFKTRDEWACEPGSGIPVAEFLVRENVLIDEAFQFPLERPEVKNLFSTLSIDQLASLIIRSKSWDSSFQPANFFSYYYVECGKDMDPGRALKALQSNERVEWAYFDPGFSLAPYDPSERNPLSGSQGYMYPAPLGIGAAHAWRKKGGRGDSTVKFVDIEQGWLFDHECLDPVLLPDTGINHDDFSDHGAAVLGIIMMRDSDSGGIGIAPCTKGFVMSQVRPDGILNTPDAILSALPYLEAGDILLLETQVPDQEDGHKLWPVEACEANFDMIRLATALGITVIEPSGNGNSASSSGNDLDDYRNSNGEKIFNRTSPGFKDSGAIMVAAATSEPPHERMYYTNYGNRIDCYAWGENILTAGMHPYSSGMAINTYTDRFGGSSGAAAIIAGVAISLQSMMEANHHCRLNPGRMRDILASHLYGTGSSSGARIDKIGVMPDLEKITKDFVSGFTGMQGMIPINGKKYIKHRTIDQFI
jgi:hypothetical protein